MVSFEVFLIGLLLISTLTGLVTEAIKKILIEQNLKYKANTLAGVVSLLLSAGVGVCYAIFTNTVFTAQIITCIIILVFMGWLCAMVGYDKVVQAISQFKIADDNE